MSTSSSDRRALRDQTRAARARERAAKAEKSAARAARAPLPEIDCPACGATIRTPMAAALDADE